MQEKNVKLFVETMHICPRYDHHWTVIEETDEPDPTKHQFYDKNGCIGYRFFKAEMLAGTTCLFEHGKSHWVFFEDRLAAAMKLMGWNPGIATDDEIITAVAKTA